MKLLVVSLSMLLASSFAFAASKKRVQNSYDSNSSYSAPSDESTSRTSVHQRNSTSGTVVQSITPEIGMVVSDMTGTGTSSKVGLLVGAELDMLKSGNVSLQTGLQYKQEGAAINNSGNVYLNYLVVPIAAKYTFVEKNSNSFFAKGGLAPAINVSHTVTDAAGNSTDLQKINTFDLGILVGAGGKIGLTREVSLLLEADYVRGLTNLGDSSFYGPLNNSAFTILSGVAFNM